MKEQRMAMWRLEVMNAWLLVSPNGESGGRLMNTWKF